MTNPDARLEAVLALIDAANAQDPESEPGHQPPVPRALLYGRRMSEWLQRLHPDPEAELQIAARGQHIRRWEVPRSRFPEGREGYLRWRTQLYGFHADRLAELMREVGYPPPAIERVAQLVGKRGLKTDPAVQLIEDCACLVFLEHYFAGFVASHDRPKLLGILGKTWKKMSPTGQAAALELSFPEELGALVREALAANG